MTGQVDEAFVDLTVRHNGEQSIRELEQQLEQGGTRAGEKGGAGLKGALGSALGALPGIALAAGAAVAAALVGGTGAAISYANQVRQGAVDIAASLGTTTQEAEALGATARKVFTNNWTGSLAEAQQAVVNVRKEIQGLAKEDVQLVTEGTVAISEKFEEEQSRVAAAVDAVMKSTGLGAQEALDFITSGFQKGLNSSGDFLDTLTEYAPQFQKAKIGGGELFSLLETGAAKGALGTDKIADAFKEFGLTIVDVNDGSKATYAELGLSQAQLVRDINSGATTQAQAFQLVTQKLGEIKGTADRTRIGAAIFGGAGEDFAGGLTQLDVTKTKLSDIAGSTDQVKNATNTLPAVFQSAGRMILDQMEPVGAIFLDLANEAMPAVQAAIAQLGPVVTTIVRFLVAGFAQGRQVAGDFAAQFGPQIERALVSFRPVLQAIGPLFSSVFNLVKTLWESVLRPALSAIAPLVTGVFTTVGNVLSLAVRVITGVVNAVTALLKGDLGGAVKAVQGIFEAGVVFMVRQFRNLGSTILGLIKNLAPQMAGAAGDIIRGLIRGIENGAGQVLQAARNLAAGVIKGVRSTLRIQSPSREMHDAGGHVSAGLAGGIEKTAPVAQKAAAKLAQGVVSEVARARAELEKGISFEKWVEGLRSASRAQLEHAQAVARSAGDAQRYSAVKAELERREGLTTAATERATAALKQQADQLAANRRQIADGEAQARYVQFLRSVPDAQLASARATARAAGEVERYNTIKAEQERREAATSAAQARATETATRAAEQLSANRRAMTQGLAFGQFVTGLQEYTDKALGAARANALAAADGQTFNAVLAEQTRRAGLAAQELSDLADAQLRAANGAAQRNPQGLTDASFRRSFGAGDAGLVRALSETTGRTVAQVRADVEGALRELGRLAPDTAAIIARVYDGALVHRREVAARTVQLARDTADKEAAAYQTRVQSVIGSIQQLSDQGLLRLYDEARATRDQTLIAAVLTEGERRAKAFKGELDAGARAGQDALDTLNQVQLGGRDLAAQAALPPDTARTYQELSARVVELQGDLGQAGVADAWTASIEAMGQRGELTARQVEALRSQILALVAAIPATPLGADVLGPGLKGDPRNAGTGSAEAQPSQNVPLPPMTEEQIAAWKQNEEAIRKATAAHQAWLDNQESIDFGRWVAGLRTLSDAELQAGLEAARASENVAQFNAYLAELNDREINVTLKINGFDTGIKQLDILKVAAQGVVDILVKTFESLVDGTAQSAGDVVRSTTIMALGVIKQIALMIAAQAAYIAVVSLIDTATLNPRALLTLAAAAAVAGIAGGLATRLGQQTPVASAAPAPGRPADPSPAGSASSPNTSITLPNSQVTIYAAPDWVAQMGGHVDRFGGYIGRLVTEGIRVSSDVRVSGSGGGLSAFDLGTP